MITRVEISGFKSFTNFAIDLAPLSVIAGANASGKSNFLDALRIVQGLAAGKSIDSVLSGRGAVKDFYTKFDEGNRSKTISIAVELLVPPVYEGYRMEGNRFRYELTLKDNAEGKEYVGPYLIEQEQLSFIDKLEDTWSEKFISPEHKDKILLYRIKADKKIKFDAVSLKYFNGEFTTTAHSLKPRNDYSMLGNPALKQNFLIVFARQALIDIDYLDLDNSGNFSNFHNRKDNSNLILSELKDLALNRKTDLDLLSMQVSQIAPSIKKINVEVDDFDRVTLIAQDRNGARYLSDSLSEGTLRTIALATLLYSKAPQRTILLEEPENGIDPRVLHKFVELLTDMVTHLDDPEAPFLQVICTTHSPALLDIIVNKKDACFATAYLTILVNTAVILGKETITTPATRINEIVPDITAPVTESRQERTTLHQAKQYLNHGRMTSNEDA